MVSDITDNRLIRKLEDISLRSQHALICYVVAGYPSMAATEKIISALVSAGADIIEIGIPFSDPIADGPIIQEASHHALLKGVTPVKCLQLASNVRNKFPKLPLLIMTYSNILLRAGFENFMIKSKRSGIDGFILPDMTFEESGSYIRQASRLNLATIFLISPNTASDRIRANVKKSSGFVYLVSVYGVTGTRGSFEDYTLRAIKNTKRIAGSGLTIAVGFGITKPSHARLMIKAGADAVIIGSAIISKIKSNNNSGEKQMLSSLKSFITGMKRACRQVPLT
jgi:tryptophan synthase alpha chain